MCYNEVDDDDDGDGNDNNNNKPNLSTFQMVHYYYNSFQWRKLTKGKHI